MAKDCKSELEMNKNIFLSWIQAKLLPTLSNNVSDTLEKMSRNLAAFNDTFSSNTDELRQTLSTVNETTRNQTALIETLQKLEITEIATENKNVYDKLKNCTAEIGQFAVYMQNVNNYLANIQTLAQKLDEYERRTQIIEQAGKFYNKNEKWLSENIDSANLQIQDALKRFQQTMNSLFQSLSSSLDGQILDFKEIMQRQQTMLQEQSKKMSEIILIGLQGSTEKQINKFNEMMETQREILRKLSDSLNAQVLKFSSVMQVQQTALLEQSQKISDIIINNFQDFTDRQISKFNETMEYQQKMLQEKSQETSEIITELKNLIAMKDSMSKLVQVADRQNSTIDRLADSVEKLIQTKTNSMTTIELSIPRWLIPTALLIVVIIIGLLITCIIRITI
jgi:IS1 family transposase